MLNAIFFDIYKFRYINDIFYMISSAIILRFIISSFPYRYMYIANENILALFGIIFKRLTHLIKFIHLYILYICRIKKKSKN